MDSLLARALNLAQLKGATYADVRLGHSTEQSLSVKNGAVEGLQQLESTGVGVRVLVDGAWGFAASHAVTAEAIDTVTLEAIQIAKASALVRNGQLPTALGPALHSTGTYRTPFTIDPFSIAIEDKIELLLQVDAAMKRVPEVHVRRGNMVFSREHKILASTEGTYIEQTLYESGASIQATAIDDEDVQHRSYPSANRLQGTAGWEYILAMHLPDHAERIATEAAQLLTAAHCPADHFTDVILGGDQMAVQIHESCGHPVELDRVYGAEAAFAGGSFLTLDKLGTFRYGSDVVTLTADALQPTGLGTFGWDDEGVPATSTPLVQAGMFVGYLMSRETAAALGLPPNGCMRASGWNRLPLIRMTNVSLEPGTWALNDMLADTDSGIFMDTNRSWSIDDKRYNFQFGTEVGYEIKRGKLGRLLKNCSYTGNTPDFWRRCDAVGNAQHWAMWSAPDCGKGQPLQVVHTGHGSAPARFRQVRVGVVEG